MKNNLQATLSVLAVAVILLFTSCKEERIYGEGKVITEQRQVDVFDKVIIDLPADAEIHVGDRNSVAVKTHGNLQEYILTEVTGSTLRVYKKSGIAKLDFSKVDITIQMPSISKLQINGAADAKIDGDLKGESFELHVRGASDVDVALMHVNKLKVQLSGASELDIHKGTVGYADYKVSGAGDIDASGLETKEVKARVSGAGDMLLHVTDKLDARISGAGEIGYTGHPEILHSKVAGIGSITDRN